MWRTSLGPSRPNLTGVLYNCLVTIVGVVIGDRVARTLSAMPTGLAAGMLLGGIGAGVVHFFWYLPVAERPFRCAVCTRLVENLGDGSDVVRDHPPARELGQLPRMFLRTNDWRRGSVRPGFECPTCRRIYCDGCQPAGDRCRCGPRIVVLKPRSIDDVFRR